MDCSELLSLRTPFVDGALDQATCEEVEAHLRGCAACNAAVESERAVLRAVKNRFLRERAPAYLRERIVDGIAGPPESVWARAREWFQSFRLGPLPSLGLAGVTLATVLVAFFGSAVERGASGDEIAIAGKVACLDCTLNRMWGAHNACAKHGHRNGILAPDGTMWTFMNNDIWSPYFRDGRLCGRSIVVHGKQYPEAHYIDLESYEFVDRVASDSSADRKAPLVGLTTVLPQHVDAVAYLKTD